MAANNMRQLIGQIGAGYYGGTKVTISKEAMDKYNEEASRDLPPLPTIDYTAGRYTPAADNGQRNRRTDRPAPSEPFKDEKVSDPVNRPARWHSHYFKDVSKLQDVDVYRVCQLFGVDDPSGATQHAIKKLLVSGKRGVKDSERDIREAVDTLNRRLQMIAEDCN